MSVRKRKWRTREGEEKEKWVVDYVAQDNTRHLKTFTKKKDADAYHAQVNVDVASGIHTPHSKSITVAEAAAEWLKHVEAEGRERSTLGQYKVHVDLHILPKIGRTKLSALTRPRIELFRDELLASMSEATGEKMTRVTARKVLSSLKALLNDAQRRGTVAQNVAHGVRIELNKRDKRRLKVGEDIPTVDEIRRMIAVAHGRQRLLVIVLAFTGLRSSELRGLRWHDVELEGAKPQLHVRQRADQWRTVGPLKSTSSEREIPLGPFVVNTMKAWRALEGNKSELVFSNASGRVHFHSTMTKRMLRPLQIAAGVTKLDASGKPAPKYSAGTHVLRHFYASWCINRKEDGGLELPLKSVQSRLGHATLAMTADTYGHLFPSESAHDELAEAEKRLGLHVA